MKGEAAMFGDQSIKDELVFSGRLVNPDGTPVPDGAYALTLSIFTEPSSGEALWSETFKQVFVSKGVFSIPVTKSALPSTDIVKGTTYLEIQTGTEIAPVRQMLDSTAFDTSLKSTPTQPVLSRDASFSFASNIAPDQLVSHLGKLTFSQVVGQASTIFQPWGIAVSGEYVFLTSREVPRRFQVINVSDPTRPSEIGSLILPPSSGSYFPEIFPSPDREYVYVLNRGIPQSGASDFGFLVIRASDPSVPTLEANYTIGNSPPYAMAFMGDLAILTNIFGNGIGVINLEKPAYPSLVGQLLTHEVLHAVAVSGNYAYVVSERDYSPGSTNTCYLFVFDLSNPSNPRIVSRTRLDQHPEHIATFVHVAGRYAYIATVTIDGGGIRGESQLLIVDIGNPSSPVVRSRMMLDLSLVYTMCVSGNWLYPQYSNRDGYDAIDITNPDQPRIATSFELTDPIEVAGTHHFLHGAIFGDYVYVVSESQNMLRVIRLP